MKPGTVSSRDSCRPLRVLLCEPYFTGSHRSWAEGLARYSAHDVRLVTHAGGFWKWRMQGAALTLAADIVRLVSTWGRPDVLLTSEMVHLPALLGFAGAALAGVPVVLYLHENQLTYPMPDNASPDHTYAMTNWLSLAARIAWSSTPSTTVASCSPTSPSSWAASPTIATSTTSTASRMPPASFRWG